MKKIVAFTLVFFTSFSLLLSQQADSLIRVCDGVYVLTGYVGNISCIITNEGVIVVDAGDGSYTGQKIQEKLKNVTSLPIIYSIITHYHYDHTGGLATFPENIPILAHQNTLDNIKKRESETKSEILTQSNKLDSLKKMVSSQGNEDSSLNTKIKEVQKYLEELYSRKFIYPNEIITDNFSIVKAKDTIVVSYNGLAHTNGDIVVWVKNKKLMIMGDLLFNHSFPYIDPIGNTTNWSKLLNEYAQLKLQYYIPGHGKIANFNDLNELAQYLNMLKTQVIAGKNEGKTLEILKSTLTFPEYESFDFQFFREENIEAVYKQIGQ